jgi:hypothetical protein
MGASSSKEEVFHYGMHSCEPAASTAFQLLLDCGVDGMVLSTSSETEITSALLAVPNEDARLHLLDKWRLNFASKTEEDTMVSHKHFACHGDIAKLVLFKHWQKRFG